MLETQADEQDEVLDENIINSVEVDKDFLKEVYVQCNTIYLAFVNFRFQELAIFVSNAALFAFGYDKMDMHS